MAFVDSTIGLVCDNGLDYKTRINFDEGMYEYYFSNIRGSYIGNGTTERRKLATIIIDILNKYEVADYERWLTI